VGRLHVSDLGARFDEDVPYRIEAQDK